MKQCGKCGKTKDQSEFYANKGKKDGLMSHCKECAKAGRNAHYRGNRSEILASQSTPEARERQNSRRRDRRWSEPEYRERENARKRIPEHLKSPLPLPHPDKEKRAKCRYVLNNAVRDGKIKRLPCWVCGNIKTHGHHPDYDRPLDVVWLCEDHHLEIHKEQENGQY